MELVCPPVGGFWRVTTWHRPFDPPAPATRPEGAIGEKIAQFSRNPAVVAKIEGFLLSSPDEEFLDDSLATGLTADEIVALGWKLAHAPANPNAEVLIDVEHWRTFRSLALPMLRAFAKFAVSLRAFDRHSLLAETRRSTRIMAGVYRQAATTDAGELTLYGLRYRSRLPPAWECWALWQPLPVETTSVESTDLTIDDLYLRTAAAQLGVVLWDMAR
jgi:hypothetical protein